MGRLQRRIEPTIERRDAKERRDHPSNVVRAALPARIQRVVYELSTLMNSDKARESAGSCIGFTPIV
jgi:hypothetical protein